MHYKMCLTGRKQELTLFQAGQPMSTWHSKSPCHLKLVWAKYIDNEKQCPHLCQNNPRMHTAAHILHYMIMAVYFNCYDMVTLIQLTLKTIQSLNRSTNKYETNIAFYSFLYWHRFALVYKSFPGYTGVQWSVVLVFIGSQYQSPTQQEKKVSANSAQLPKKH